MFEFFCAKNTQLTNLWRFQLNMSACVYIFMTRSHLFSALLVYLFSLTSVQSVQQYTFFYRHICLQLQSWKALITAYTFRTDIWYLYLSKKAHTDTLKRCLFVKAGPGIVS